MIEAQGVTVRAGSATLVDDVALSAQPGELVAVIGPNGAGKSTLLRVLGGDLRPAEGTVFLGQIALAEIDIPTMSEYRSMFTPESGTPVPFSVWEVAMMGRHPRRRDPDNSAANDTAVVEQSLERMGVARLAHRVHDTLSSGERTRVGMARVFAQEAPVLLLDEPTTALDVGHEMMMMGEIRAEAARRRAVVAVLHDLNSAARFATSIIAMHEGRIVATGSPQEVLNEDLLTEIYRHPMQVMPRPGGDGVLVIPGDKQ